MGAEDPVVAGPTEAPSTSDELDVALDLIKRVEDRPLARVNGEDLLWDEYEAILLQTLNTISRQSPVKWSDPANQERFAQVQNDVLRQAVDRLLLRQVAAKEKIVVAPEDLAQTIEKQKAQIESSEQYDSFQDFLDSSGLTEKTFEIMIYDTMVLQSLMAAQDVVTMTQQVHLAHIVVEDEATAKDIHDQLQAGGDFQELASKHSTDEQTKDQGGDIGWMPEETLVPELRDPISKLEPGEFSEPIKTQYGVSVFRLVERGLHESNASTLVRLQQQAVQALLDAEKATASIEYLVDFSQLEP